MFCKLITLYLQEFDDDRYYTIKSIVAQTKTCKIALFNLPLQLITVCTYIKILYRNSVSKIYMYRIAELYSFSSPFNMFIPLYQQFLYRIIETINNTMEHFLFIKKSDSKWSHFEYVLPLFVLLNKWNSVLFWDALCVQSISIPLSIQHFSHEYIYRHICLFMIQIENAQL